MKRLVIIAVAVLAAASCVRSVPLRLASYNLHHCESPSGGGARYDGIVSVLKSVGADVVALQELDSCTVRASEFQVAEIAGGCGMEYLYCPTIPFGGGKYGIGMLYDPSLTLVSVDRLALPGLEPRGALVAEFGDFVFICTHLCHKSDSLRGAALGIIDDYVSEHFVRGRKPVFLAGDLNASSWTGSFGDAISSHWISLGVDEPTFFDCAEPHRIDYILQYRGIGRQAQRLESFIPEVAGVALDSLSDHHPVVVDLSLR